MTIKVFEDKIEFDNYTLSVVPTGISLNGKIKSDEFVIVDLMGEVSGYTSGGGPSDYNNIDKFSFTSDANATDVGDLSQGRYQTSGQFSLVSAYTSGGQNPLAPAPFQTTNRIDKFPFASDTNATDIADLSIAKSYVTGQSSVENGYVSGGNSPLETFTVGIERFPFATDINASVIGNLTTAKRSSSGQFSTIHGYTSGGVIPPFTSINTIEKFPFASESNVTDVGDLTEVRSSGTGQSSAENGYFSGGSGAYGGNEIQKFPFATDANATDVGNLSLDRSNFTGQSSTVSGYNSGGTTPLVRSNVIDKFPFATDANATDVGDLTLARTSAAGQQV